MTCLLHHCIGLHSACLRLQLVAWERDLSTDSGSRIPVLRGGLRTVLPKALAKGTDSVHELVLLRTSEGRARVTRIPPHPTESATASQQRLPDHAPLLCFFLHPTESATACQHLPGTVLLVARRHAAEETGMPSRSSCPLLSASSAHSLPRRRKMARIRRCSPRWRACVEPPRMCGSTRWGPIRVLSSISCNAW